MLPDPPNSSTTENLQYLSQIDVRKDSQNKGKQFVLVSQNNDNILTGNQQSIGKIEEAFVIVRSFKNRDGTPQGYQINAGNIIKLGRIEYSIMEMRKSDLKIISNPNKNLFINPQKYYFSKAVLEKETKGKICRICLDEFLPEQACPSHPLDNLLLAACNCKGSCQYSHYLCLRNWIESKVQKKCQGNTMQYNFKRLECEVCKEPLPKIIMVDDQQLDLIPIERPQSSYVILESIIRDKRTVNGIYLLQLLPEDQIKMGRGHYCELRVTDISVSRFHAYIKNIEDQFLLFDNNSKFGTLILMNPEYKLSEKKVAIQIGRTVLSLVMKNTTLTKSLVASFYNSTLMEKPQSIKPQAQPAKEQQSESMDVENSNKEEEENYMDIENANNNNQNNNNNNNINNHE